MLWNDLSTIALCRIVGISEIKEALYNPERNIGITRSKAYL
jgi:hypothetical protein